MSYLGKLTDRVSRNTYTYTATSGQTTFSATYTPGNVDVYQNGVKLVNGQDFTATNGTSVVLTTGAVVNDVVEIVGYTAVGLTNTYTKGEVDGNFVRSDVNQRKNYLINGKFNIWQRAITQTSSGYGSDDRWNNSHVGSTKTHSQQAFTVGQTDVSGNPTYYSRTVVTSVAGAGNYVNKFQPIEDVINSSGRTFTLSFYAKADGNKNIAVEFKQNFGSGGSPEVTGDSITGGVKTFTLTSSWQKFTATVTFPSVSGKTLGSNNYFAVTFWFDAGSSFNSRTNLLGQQSGTFDIAQVQLEEGSLASSFEYRTTAEELALCQRYYQIYPNVLVSGYNSASGTVYNDFLFSTPMRVVPSPTYSSITYSNASGYNTNAMYTTHMRLSIQITATGAGYGIATVELTAEL
jgi:hypothetical protein